MRSLRRSSLPAAYLALLMGMALAWPALAHHRFHEQIAHEYEDLAGVPSPELLGISAAQHEMDHPHLDLTAAPPAKASLHLVFLVSRALQTDKAVMARVYTVARIPASCGPRSPPSTPSPSIRAPPTA